MTSFRLYLSANAPHSGTSGSPKMNMSAFSRPTRRGIARGGSPIDCRSSGRKAEIWLTPMVSTTDVIEKISSTAIQDCRGMLIGPSCASTSSPHP